jgi:hypothetical protein
MQWRRGACSGASQLLAPGALQQFCELILRHAAAAQPAEAGPFCASIDAPTGSFNARLVISIAATALPPSTPYRTRRSHRALAPPLLAAPLRLNCCCGFLKPKMTCCFCAVLFTERSIALPLITITPPDAPNTRLLFPFTVTINAAAPTISPHMQQRQRCSITSSCPSPPSAASRRAIQ